MLLFVNTHCISCYKNYKDAHILYGQGNFNFIHENASEIWNHSLIVKYDTKLNEIEFVPTVNTEYSIEFAKGDIREKIMQDFNRRNESLENGTWKDGWREFCESVSDIYVFAAQSGAKISKTHTEELFAHYIDCEAHTDAWKEPFKTWNNENEI